MTNSTNRHLVRRSMFAGLLVATGGLMFAGAPTAEAHQVCMELGRNWGCVSSNHQTVSVHDEQCDNRYFYTQYRTTQVPGATYTISDQNGCNSGGTYDTVTPYRVTAIRVCNALDDCLPWKSA